MKKAQIFCTLNEVIQDMHLRGDEGSILERIKAASVTIDREIGNFIPIVETRSFSGRCDRNLKVDPLLEVTDAITDNGVTVSSTEFTLLPESPQWIHGAYNMIKKTYGLWGYGSVAVPGSWGKYSELAAVMDSFTMTDKAVELTVLDGSLLDVGMVLLIEDEQIAISGGHGSTNSPDADAATSKVNGAIIEADQVITVDNGAEFHRGEVLAIGNEDLLITRISGNDLTVERGWNNTLIEDHADDAAIGVYRTFAVDRGVNGTTAAAHTSRAVERYLVPADINWICRQIAGLMHKKAQSGFQGMVGNAETGQTSFYSEYPPQLNRIRQDYSMKVY